LDLFFRLICAHLISQNDVLLLTQHPFAKTLTKLSEDNPENAH